MSTSIIYAEIRTYQPFIVNGIRFEADQVYALLRFPGRESFEHFRANLGWSAFKVVECEEKAIKADTLAAAAGVTVAQLDEMGALKTTLAEQVERISALNRQLYAERVGKRDFAAILATLTPSHLGFIDPVMAQVVITNARLAVQARNPTAAIAPIDPVAEARTAALEDLESIDGIGPAIAERLHDQFGITTLPALAAALADPVKSAALIGPTIREPQLIYWRRQLADVDPQDPAVATAPTATTAQPGVSEAING